MAQLGDKPTFQGAVRMVAPWALSLAAVAFAVFAVLMLGSGSESKSCPPVTARQGAVQYELLTRRCEAVRHGALEQFARRD